MLKITVIQYIKFCFPLFRRQCEDREPEQRDRPAAQAAPGQVRGGAEAGQALNNTWSLMTLFYLLVKGLGRYGLLI